MKLKYTNIKTSGEPSGGSGGSGGSAMAIYSCIFCGANHIQGNICPELKKLLRPSKEKTR